LRNKILASLVLIVLLPTALLAWLGQRMVHNEQQVLEAQLRTLINSQLGGVDTSIQGYFRTVQHSLLEEARQLDGSAESLRKISLVSPLVKHVLVIGADGKLAFPAPLGPWSQAEKEFLQRTSAIVENPALLTQGAALPERDAPVPAAQGLLSKKFSAAGIPAAPQGDAGPPALGWYAWHWNAELRHMFWWRDGRQRVIGFELAPVAVMSDIIAGLPATDGRAAASRSVTRLVNGSGQVVYEWGAYRPAANEKSLAVWPLSHPLGSWKLEYFAPPLGGGAAASSFGVLASVVVIGLALAVLALYLYREHSREMRIAQQRVNFVNQVSHELKTPLTNIRLYAELLQTEVEQALADKDEAPPDSKAEKYIGIIVAESQRLSRLIGNVLSFGRFQKAELRLNLEPAQVDDVIQRCIAAFQPALDAKGIAVTFDSQAGALVLLDPQALEQIFNNLVGNVEKYASVGATLQVSSAQDGMVTTIDVRDFGPGIAAAERERVFEPFYRVSSQLADGVTGTGIGLDIARRLARLHGGDVTLREVDRGACFRIVLHTPPHGPSAGESA